MLRLSTFLPPIIFSSIHISKKQCHRSQNFCVTGTDGLEPPLWIQSMVKNRACKSQTTFLELVLKHMLCICRPNDLTPNVRKCVKFVRLDIGRKYKILDYALYMINIYVYICMYIYIHGFISYADMKL